MKITEVRIFPTESKDGKLKAFATMTFDDWFVVRNVKIIQGNNGLFVAMPSRKAVDPCPRCNFKNVRGSKYCNQCGTQVPLAETVDESTGKSSGNHMDIAHPITQDCRVYIQDSILGAYKGEGDKQRAEGASHQPINEEALNNAASQFSSEKKSASNENSGGSAGAEDTQDIEL